MVLCDHFFAQKSINDLNDRNLDFCNKYYDKQHETTQQMDMRGATLIHEYTHYPPLTANFLGPTDRVTDYENGYGVYNAQLLKSQDGWKAMTNADNYANFAMEFYWARNCGKGFAPRSLLRPRPPPNPNRNN